MNQSTGTPINATPEHPDLTRSQFTNDYSYYLATGRRTALTPQQMVEAVKAWAESSDREPRWDDLDAILAAGTTTQEGRDKYPVDTGELRELRHWLYDESHYDKSLLVGDAVDELDRLRAVDEFGMDPVVKAAADDWFDQHAPSNVSMDDLNLLVHMITEKLRGTRG